MTQTRHAQTREDCLAVCRICSHDVVPRPIPFGSRESCLAWIEEHHKDTRHDVAFVEGWPSAERAWQLAFGLAAPKPTADQRPRRGTRTSR